MFDHFMKSVSWHKLLFGVYLPEKALGELLGEVTSREIFLLVTYSTLKFFEFGHVENWILESILSLLETFKLLLHRAKYIVSFRRRDLWTKSEGRMVKNLGRIPLGIPVLVTVFQRSVRETVIKSKKIICYWSVWMFSEMFRKRFGVLCRTLKVFGYLRKIVGELCPIL